jgi:aminoglycoside phosphotransferase family enzyme
MSTVSSTVLSRIHGDYHPWNTLHKNQKIYVIDWIFRYGDYRYDVMWTYALLYRSGFEDFAQRFLNRYKKRLDIDNQDFFLTLANLRWFVNVKLSLKQQQQEDLYDIIKFQSEKLNELNPYFSDKMLSFE